MPRRGRPKKIGNEQLPILREIVGESPLATLAEVRDEFARRTGIPAHEITVRKALTEAGIERRRDRAERSGGPDSGESSASGPPRYGYTSAHRVQSSDATYATSLTDHEWELIEDIFDSEGGRGKPPRYARRLLVDACCYVVRTGCSWRMLPSDFPPWQNVYRTFRRWSAQGKFERMHDRLRAQWRTREAREEAPSAAVIDAQSTRGSPQGGENGYDAGKKVKGRKRHLVVDTLGLLLAVSVTAASVQDRDGAHPVMAQAIGKYPSVETVFADSGYAGRCAQTISQQQGVRMEIVRHPANANVGRWAEVDQADLFTHREPRRGFVVLPKRWVVERTHAWIEKARRLMIHHDRRADVSESWVWLASARMLLRRLTAHNM